MTAYILWAIGIALWVLAFHRPWNLRGDALALRDWWFWGGRDHARRLLRWAVLACSLGILVGCTGGVPQAISDGHAKALWVTMAAAVVFLWVVVIGKGG